MPSQPGHGGSPSHSVEDYWWYVARSDLLRTALARYAVNAAVALDLGSADGPSAGWIPHVADHVVSLDIDPRGLSTTGICGSAMALPFADETFDLVSAFDVIEHCEPEATALAEVARVLRPGGSFLMAVPAYRWAWSDHDVANGHHRRYTRARAAQSVGAAGLTIDRVTHGFATVFPFFAAERLDRLHLPAGGDAIAGAEVTLADGRTGEICNIASQNATESLALLVVASQSG